MKKLLMNNKMKSFRLNMNSLRKVFLAVLVSLVVFSGFQAAAQPQQLPIVGVRFFNPTFDCPTQNYCVDVQFMTDTPGLQVFAMNIRFFYDDQILEFLSFGDFVPGYSSPEPPAMETFGPESGDFFGMPGSSMDWVNGYVQLESYSDVYLSNEWVTLFRMCFHVDDPNSLRIYEFCPAIIWDLQENPPEIWAGYLEGDDGVVITVVSQIEGQESEPITENVVHLNWQYDGIPDPPVGFPVPIICIPTCPPVIPLSDWSLYLAIGLMLVVSIFIYRRRISG